MQGDLEMWYIFTHALGNPGHNENLKESSITNNCATTFFYKLLKKVNTNHSRFLVPGNTQYTNSYRDLTPFLA